MHPDESAQVIFPLANPQEVISVRRSIPHPNASIDLAVLELARPARSDVERYELYRDDDEVSQIFFKIGYGLSGDGRRGDRHASLPDKAIWIRNRYDSLVDIFLRPSIMKPAHLIHIERAAIGEFDPLSYLVFDFDDGDPKHDAFGIHFGFQNTGLGEEEGMTSGGDSGSPSFIGRKIVGIASDGFSDYKLFPDGKVADVSVVEAESLDELRQKVGSEEFDEMVEVHRGLDLEPSLEQLQNAFSDDASVGEFGLDVRVSRVATFIDEVLGGRL